MDAKDRALKYLAIRPRTKKQMDEYLRSKGCSAGEIRDTLRLLEEYHYLDDLEYARLYIQDGIMKNRGMARIRRELQQHGVDRDLVEDALAELDEMEVLPDEHDMALKFAADMVRDLDISAMDRQEKEKIKGRIARRLASRGFSAETIYSAVRKAIQAREEEGAD